MLRRPLDAFGMPTGGAMMRQPMAAGPESAFQSDALRGTRVGDGGDEQAAHGQPILYVGEVVGDESRNSLGGQRGVVLTY
jgi:hypothetical protein